MSEDLIIDNSVFQDTVLGPPLWNSFFSDVSVPAQSISGQESMFAGDLNVFQKFNRLQPLPEVTSSLQKCRTNVHRWGRSNRVSFDASREHVIVLHPVQHHGAAFNFLGCLVDTDLRMQSAIDQLTSIVNPKITAMLRSRAYYSVPQLLMQFKTHIWGLMEAHMGGIFHAATYSLAKIDHAQSRCLRELGISPEHALLEFNFPSAHIRRNIDILALLHKRVLELYHKRVLGLMTRLCNKPDTVAM